MGFSPKHSPDSLNNTLLSQGCILENRSHRGSDQQSVQSEDTGRVRKLLILGPAQGQSAVASSQDLTQQSYSFFFILP